MTPSETKIGEAVNELRQVASRLCLVAQPRDIGILHETAELLQDVEDTLIHASLFARAVCDPASIEILWANGSSPSGAKEILRVLRREAVRLKALVEMDLSTEPPILELAEFVVAERRDA